MFVTGVRPRRNGPTAAVPTCPAGTRAVAGASACGDPPPAFGIGAAISCNISPHVAVSGSAVSAENRDRSSSIHGDGTPSKGATHDRSPTFPPAPRTPSPARRRGLFVDDLRLDLERARRAAPAADRQQGRGGLHEPQHGRAPQRGGRDGARDHVPRRGGCALV